MSVVTRFPPSPTGFMHIGNARTALFNWLYAKHTGGKMLFRIEDTDRKRHSEEAVEAIIRSMQWLGLDWDGEIVSQFSRLERHREVAEELIAKGQAYYCYCTPEELDEMREKARAAGSPTFYDRRWRDRNPSEAPQGIEPVIRIKAPLDGASTVHDLVQGEVTVNNIQLDDFIILRSDGTPTYMLSVVVDDHDMGVTHILRGDDHLNNTFRQKVIFDAMGWDLPEFGHLPLIHGPDGGKFSKRHGAQGVEEYKEMGYLPEALCNYLMRLGWSHGDDEIISRDQAIDWFDVSGINKAPARFDFDKLESLNAHYIKETAPERLIELALPFFEKHHGLSPDTEAQKRIIAGIDELKSRSKTLVQFAEEAAFYAKTTPLDMDEKAAALLDQTGRQTLKELAGAFEALKSFSSDDIQSACKAIAKEKHEGKLGKVAMPLRAALTGRSSSPSIFHAAEILGKKETLMRIQACINTP